MYNDTLDNYILRKLTLDEIRPHIEGCEIMASNIMFISTPNLYNKATGVSYTESYHESLGAVNDYVEFFGNAQHRLPPVSYENRILDSDYAIFMQIQRNMKQLKHIMMLQIYQKQLHTIIRKIQVLFHLLGVTHRCQEMKQLEIMDMFQDYIGTKLCLMNMFQK